MTWRWPWVSRALYDVVVSQRDDARDDARMTQSVCETFRQSLLERAEQAEHAAAVANETITTLREQKAAQIVTIQTLRNELDAVRRERDELAARPSKPGKSKLTQAIRDNARMPDGTIDRRLVNHFRTEANKLLRRGSKEADVIESLSQWQTTENRDGLSADRMADTFDAETV